MRLLAIILVLAALAWGGYWTIGSRTLEQQTAAWFDARRAEGWVADSSVEVKGFPNRFDLSLQDVTLADPDTGLAWNMPFFQALALSYKPNEVIAVWPSEQTVSTPYEKLQVNTEDMRARVNFSPESALTLQWANLVIDAARLRSDAGWEAAVDQLRLAFRQNEESPETYDIGFEAEGLSPPQLIRSRLDPMGALPEKLLRLRLDATARFDRPWDRRAIEDRRPQPRQIELKEAKAQWGELDLRLAGALDLDPEGYPAGEITVRAENWRDILQLAVNARTIPSPLASTAESVLTMLANASGSPNSLEVPITFADRRMSFGPIPLGPAPRLVLR